MGFVCEIVGFVSDNIGGEWHTLLFGDLFEERVDCVIEGLVSHTKGNYLVMV